MRFSTDKPIFAQIEAAIEDDILSGHLGPGDRIPSARELGSSLEVNPNTAARALQCLADSGVARVERGTGYFVSDDGADLVRQNRRRSFFEETLPGIFKTMDSLGVEPHELLSLYASRGQRESPAAQKENSGVRGTASVSTPAAERKQL